MKQLRATFPNLDIENRWISYSAYVDKISLITSTGDLADLQFANAFNDVPLMMDSKLLLETGPLLDKLGNPHQGRHAPGGLGLHQLQWQAVRRRPQHLRPQRLGHLLPQGLARQPGGEDPADTGRVCPSSSRT